MPDKDPTITTYTTPTYNPSYTAPTGTAGTYQITSYLYDYSTTNQKGGALNSGSALTIATGGGTGTGSGRHYQPCSGLQTPGGQNTYYAGASIRPSLSSLPSRQTIRVPITRSSSSAMATQTLAPRISRAPSKTQWSHLWISTR